MAVLAASAIIRFWGLGSAELFHDEGLYAFRSIGYLDYLKNEDQTTPIQWFQNTGLPTWTALSFHDHPPFFFLVQNIFFRVFGDSLFVARVPSALAGIFAAYCMYLLGKRFFKNEYAGIISAFLLSISLMHIWISRSSLMESVLVALILWNIYLFFRWIDNPRRWILFGVTLGLCFLTKYTSFFLIPVYGAYLLIAHRSLFRTRSFYAVCVCAGLIFSPVILYNIFLFQATGHFDLQFAYVFGQETPEWRASFGKILDPFSDIFKNLQTMYSIPSLFLFVGGLIYSIIAWFKTRNTYIVFGWLTLLGITAMLGAVGAGFRFIALYAPFFIFFIVLLASFFYQKYRQSQLIKIVCIAFIVYELVFSIQGIFIEFPDFGVRKLDQYFDEAFGTARSLYIPQSDNPHLNEIIKSNALKYPVGKKVLIVYDENIGLSQKLWLFSRRLYYHAIPVTTVRQFTNTLRDNGISYFAGYEIYFVKATSYTQINQSLFLDDGDRFETFVSTELGIVPDRIIYGHYDVPMFIIYTFVL